MSAAEIAILTSLPAAFIGAFVGALLSVYLAARDKSKRDEETAHACLVALRNITAENLNRVAEIMQAQQGGASGPAQVLPALQVSIYGALLPQLPLVGVAPDVIVEVGKTFAFLKDMQELHYTILNLNLADIAPMRDAIRRSEPIFTGEARKQLQSLATALQGKRLANGS